MNIAKLQAQLQRVPDQALIRYVQNPDGQVPSYLALAELQRRKDIRKTAQPSQPAPTQTVAEQEVAEQGVSALPVRDDMYNEESYASGGIVAFADGGPTSSDIAYGNAMDQSFLGWMPRAGGAIASDVMGLPGQFAWMRDPVTGKLVRRYEVEGWMPEYSGFESAEAARRESRGKQYEAAVAKEKEAKAMAQTPTPTPTVAQPSAGSFRPYADPRMIADKNKAQIQADIAAGKYDRPAPVAPAAPVAQRTAPVGIGSLYTPPQDFSAEYEKMMRPEVSAQEAMAKYQGLLGEDASRAAMKERINKMEARAAKEEAQAPWLALAEAGLGMAAGKSQFALQNIAEGGKQGIKSFVDAKDRMVKAEERRFDMASRVAQAERAEQVAAATYGLQSEERAKAHNDVVQQNKLKYKADLASDNAKNEFNAKKFKLEYAQKDREIDLMDKRIDKQIASAENTSLRYELQNKRDSLKTALNEINDMLKNEQASLNPDPAKIAGLQRKFDAAYNALYSLAIQGSGSQPTGNRPPLGSFNLK